MVPVTSAIGQEVGVEGENILNQRVTMNLCTSLVLHLEQANNRGLSREMIWREKSLDGKEKLCCYRQTISNHLGDETLHHHFTIQSHFFCSGFYDKSWRVQKSLEGVFCLFVFFSPQISIPCHTFNVCHITLLPMLYLLDVFIYLTFYTTHNILILWKYS